MENRSWCIISGCVGCENETRAIREFVNQHDFVISVSYHTYGEYILYPWGYTKEPSPDNDVFMPVADNISKINNYTTIQGSLSYPTLGDSDDWL